MSSNRSSRLPHSSAGAPSRRRHLLARGLLWLFTGVGLLIAGLVAVDWVQGLATWRWTPQSCTVDAAGISEEAATGHYRFSVSYHYEIGDTVYIGDRVRHGYSGSADLARARRLEDRFAPGAEVPCWVDPDDPARSALLRANLWSGFLVLLPLGFAAMGLGALWLQRRRYGTARAKTGGETRLGGPGTGFTGRAAIAEDGEGSAQERGLPLGRTLVGFFSIFLIVGLGLFIPFTVLPVLRVLDARAWPATECEILESSVRTHHDEDHNTYSIAVRYRYWIDGREHTGSRYHFGSGSTNDQGRQQRIVDAMPPGTRLPCYVDPEDPYTAVIDRGLGLTYLFGLIPLVFALAGGGGLLGLLHVRRVGRRRGQMPGGDSSLQAVTVAGPVELPRGAGPSARLGCSLVSALCWNGFLAFFVLRWYESYQQGDAHWILALILLPFVLVGLLLVLSVPYAVLALANPRPRVWLDRGAVPAGEDVEIRWSFDGAAGRIRRLRMWLEATTVNTEANRGRGVSVRRSAQQSHDSRIDLADLSHVQSPASGVLCRTIPATTRPTSSTEPVVAWRLHLQGSIRWWPDVNERFDLVILPAAPDD